MTHNIPNSEIDTQAAMSALIRDIAISLEANFKLQSDLAESSAESLVATVESINFSELLMEAREYGRFSDKADAPLGAMLWGASSFDLSRATPSPEETPSCKD